MYDPTKCPNCGLPLLLVDSQGKQLYKCSVAQDPSRDGVLLSFDPERPLRMMATFTLPTKDGGDIDRPLLPRSHPFYAPTDRNNTDPLGVSDPMDVLRLDELDYIAMRQTMERDLMPAPPAGPGLVMFASGFFGGALTMLLGVLYILN